MLKIDSTKVSQNKLKQNVAFSSSGIFYAYSDDANDTRVTFLNHFLLKRNIKNITALITFRDLEGNSISNKTMNINQESTYSLSCREEVGHFEGSVEVEFFSSVNVVVPFTAIVAVYEFENSICQIHSVSRVYSKTEMENRKFTIGEEAGWTCRDTKDIFSLALISNGFASLDMPVSFEVINSDGAKKNVDVGTVSLKPFETYKLIPKNHFDIASFLDGKEGHISVSFKTQTSFPRFICGNAKEENGKMKEIQLTHSNFNYHKIDTDRLDDPKEYGILDTPPTMSTRPMSAIIYPNFQETKDLSIEVDNNKIQLFHDKINIVPLKTGQKPVITTSDKRGLPNRIVSGLVSNWCENRLPSECSLGMITPGYVNIKKHWYWGLADSKNLDCTLTIITHVDFLSLDGFKDKIEINLYDKNGLCAEKTLPLTEGQQSIQIGEIYSKKPEGDVWYTVVSDYPVISVFSTMISDEKKSGCIEHSF